MARKSSPFSSNPTANPVDSRRGPSIGCVLFLLPKRGRGFCRRTKVATCLVVLDGVGVSASVVLRLLDYWKGDENARYSLLVPAERLGGFSDEENRSVNKQGLSRILEALRALGPPFVSATLGDSLGRKANGTALQAPRNLRPTHGFYR